QRCGDDKHHQQYQHDIHHGCDINFTQNFVVVATAAGNSHYANTSGASLPATGCSLEAAWVPLDFVLGSLVGVTVGLMRKPTFCTSVTKSVAKSSRSAAINLRRRRKKL